MASLQEDIKNDKSDELTTMLLYQNIDLQDLHMKTRQEFLIRPMKKLTPMERKGSEPDARIEKLPNIDALRRGTGSSIAWSFDDGHVFSNSNLRRDDTQEPTVTAYNGTQNGKVVTE